MQSKSCSGARIVLRMILFHFIKIKKNYLKLLFILLFFLKVPIFPAESSRQYEQGRILNVKDFLEEYKGKPQIVVFCRSQIEMESL